MSELLSVRICVICGFSDQVEPPASPYFFSSALGIGPEWVVSKAWAISTGLVRGSARYRARLCARRRAGGDRGAEGAPREGSRMRSWRRRRRRSVAIDVSRRLMFARWWTLPCGATHRRRVCKQRAGQHARTPIAELTARGRLFWIPAEGTLGECRRCIRSEAKHRDASSTSSPPRLRGEPGLGATTPPRKASAPDQNRGARVGSLRITVNCIAPGALSKRGRSSLNVIRRVRRRNARSASPASAIPRPTRARRGVPRQRRVALRHRQRCSRWGYCLYESTGESSE